MKTQNKNFPESTLEERLKKLRKEAGESQESISEYLQMDSKSYGRYERGDRTPSLEIIIALAKHYGTTTDYLLMGKKPSSHDILFDFLNEFPEEKQDIILDLLTKTLREIFSVGQKL